MNLSVTILNVHKCLTPVTKAVSEILNCSHYFSSNAGKLAHLFIPSKTATLVPELIPLGSYAIYSEPSEIIAALVHESAVKDLPSAELHPKFLNLQ